MKRWMLHASVFAVGALVAAFAWPQGPARRHGIDAVYDELGLTSVVAAEKRKLDERVGPQCMVISEKRRLVFGELAKEKVDGAAVDAALAEIAAIRAQIQRDVVEHLVAVRPLLTPDQRTRLFERLSRGETR